MKNVGLKPAELSGQAVQKSEHLPTALLVERDYPHTILCQFPRKYTAFVKTHNGHFEQLWVQGLGEGTRLPLRASDAQHPHEEDKPNSPCLPCSFRHDHPL